MTDKLDTFEYIVSAFTKVAPNKNHNFNEHFFFLYKMFIFKKSFLKITLKTS